MLVFALRYANIGRQLVPDADKLELGTENPELCS